ncbi:hypothetical protein RSSM_05155 [Rhodopirellula sallentina SM41]|uniref:Uncharacterized protein n=1 Tax=Rhodopirellula sallentina SM41 TaxID=1263870 RepID=M5UBM4_9BACT|nr:hypothetical protein RSSM_05155 [Rhodopirellula sallentina SM41]
MEPFALFHTDLKRTEIAMNAGRLDEAFALLKSSPSRHHRDAQTLVDRLVDEFVRRGNQHFDDGRADDARHDADAAYHLGGRQIEIAKLRQRIAQHLEEGRELRFTSERGGVNSRGDILQVDGIGSLLLLRSDTVSIGGESTTAPLDISLRTVGVSKPIRIYRDDEDYFWQCESQRLLSSGDSIAVGRRGRLRFTRAVAASNSAILDVSGAKLFRSDVRRVVLVADSVLFGHAGCHFTLPNMNPPVILQPSGDAYTLHRQGGYDTQTLMHGDSVCINDIRFTLTVLSHSKALV